jgi:16S rRNA (guanine(966)-N(2))-methyltransferase RsmD
MRVISGSAKGRRLATLHSWALRPTPDRVREALFNILGASIVDARVLDLFAGSGAIGLEALSRGAYSVVFVESHAPACRLINKNVRLCGLHTAATVWQDNVLQAIPALKSRGVRFDLIFLDPPYQASLVEDTLTQLSDGVLLAPTGVVVAEHFFKRQLQEQYGQLHSSRLARFGDVALNFYRRVSATSSSPPAGQDTSGWQEQKTRFV